MSHGLQTNQTSVREKQFSTQIISSDHIKLGSVVNYAKEQLRKTIIRRDKQGMRLQRLVCAGKVIMQSQSPGSPMSHLSMFQQRRLVHLIYLTLCFLLHCIYSLLYVCVKKRLTVPDIWLIWSVYKCTTLEQWLHRVTNRFSDCILAH